MITVCLFKCYLNIKSLWVTPNKWHNNDVCDGGTSGYTHTPPIAIITSPIYNTINDYTDHSYIWCQPTLLPRLDLWNRIQIYASSTLEGDVTGDFHSAKHTTNQTLTTLYCEERYPHFPTTDLVWKIWGFADLVYKI